MKAIRKYFKNRRDSIIVLLHKPRNTYNADTFHRLRVEIKKLNAFFELLHFCVKDFKRTQTFKPFKKIFKQAGKVREIQVEEAMLKKFLIADVLKERSAQLKKRRLKEQEKYFSAADDSFMESIHKTFRSMEPFLAEVTKKKVNLYVEKQRKSIEKLLGVNNIKVSEVHELRKQLKNFIYNCKLLNCKMGNKSLQPKADLAELIGEWNDCMVTVSDLKKAMNSNSVNYNEVSEIKRIINKIDADSEILFNQINQAIFVCDFYESRLS